MSEQFPKIKPSQRSFSMGDYPSKTYTSLSGVVFRRAFGNVQTGYSLDLQFKNISDTNANLIMQHYINVEGTFSSFTLPNEVFAAMASGLKGKIQSPNSNIKWRYAAPPEVSQVINNISTVSVKLSGELEAS